MKSPPVLVPPQQGKPFKLYVSADRQTIGLALMQEFEGKERVIFYLSRRLLDLQDILLLKNYAYAYISPALNCDIIYYWLSV